MSDNPKRQPLRWNPVIIRHRVGQKAAAPFLMVRVTTAWVFTNIDMVGLDREATLRNVASHTRDRVLRAFPDAAFQFKALISDTASSPEITVTRMPLEEEEDAIVETVRSALDLARYDVFTRGHGLVMKTKPSALRWRSLS